MLTTAVANRTSVVAEEVSDLIVRSQNALADSETIEDVAAQQTMLLSSLAYSNLAIAKIQESSLLK